MLYDISGCETSELFLAYVLADPKHTLVVPVPASATTMLITSETSHQDIWFSFNGVAGVANWKRVSLSRPGKVLTEIVPAGTVKVYFRKLIQRQGYMNPKVSAQVAQALPVADVKLAYGGDTIAGIDVSFDIRH